MIQGDIIQKPKKNAIILLNKAEGITSFSALGFVKRNVNRKTGHTGTLDKFAGGLIIALSGKYTKYNDIFMGLDKTYIAEIEFGKETDTLDPEGALTDTKAVPDISLIKEKVASYVGIIEQTPPAYSAVHVNGRRSYEIARSGDEVLLSPRYVSIYNVEIIDWTSPFLTVRLHVSKGTYVRSYARDLGRLCSSCAYVRKLKRTQIGPFVLENAIDYNDVNALSEANEEDAETLLEKLREYKDKESGFLKINGSDCT